MRFLVGAAKTGCVGRVVTLEERAGPGGIQHGQDGVRDAGQRDLTAGVASSHVVDDEGTEVAGSEIFAPLRSTMKRRAVGASLAARRAIRNGSSPSTIPPRQRTSRTSLQRLISESSCTASPLAAGILRGEVCGILTLRGIACEYFLGRNLLSADGGLVRGAGDLGNEKGHSENEEHMTERHCDIGNGGSQPEHQDRNEPGEPVHRLLITPH